MDDDATACRTCKFYAYEQCHRYPPVRIPECDGWHWPDTDHEDWCGEYAQ